MCCGGAVVSALIYRSEGSWFELALGWNFFESTEPLKKNGYLEFPLENKSIEDGYW